SRRGEIVLPVSASEELKPGQAFAAMHWGGRSLSHAGVNQLMLAATDPVSRQPELKHAAIRIERAELPWRLVVLRAAESAAPEEEVLVWRERLARLLPDFGYAALTLAGRDHPLLALDVASAQPVAEDRLAAMAALLDLGECTVYRDPRRGIVKMARIDAAGDHLQGLLLAGETAAADWLRDLMTSGRPLGELRRWLFAPVAKPPLALPPAGRTVCNCFGVTDTEIKALLGQGLDLAGVQAQLKCGSSCGSCLPELRRMATQAAPTVPAGA
ncbi:MAG: molybdopterin dinucleotide binding domain-containing protein, partial [Sulfuritalea sp.]|nr:molybdopterin dinucleotide binding domain-containing protein [Sulfuritalea sp.]